MAAVTLLFKSGGRLRPESDGGGVIARPQPDHPESVCECQQLTRGHKLLL